MAVATQKMNEEQINALNLAMRQQPWYQDFFRSRGLNPDRVQLSGSQQAALSALAAANGFQLGDRMKIDAAGNINQKGGFAGMPTWAKIAISAAPAAATLGFGAAGIGPAAGLFGSGGAGAAGTGATTAAGAAGASSSLPTLASASLTSGLGVSPSLTGASTLGGVITTGAGYAGNRATPSVFGKIADSLTNPSNLMSMGGRVLGAMGQAGAQNRGAQIEAQLAADRMGLERDQLRLQAEKSARDNQSDAMNKALWGQYVSNYQPSGQGKLDHSISDEARAAGKTLYEQAAELMRSGNYTNVNPQTTSYDQMPTKPGLMERIATYAAPGLSLFDPRLYDERQPDAHLYR